MHALNEIFATIDSYIGGSPWFVYLLLGTGLFFTLYLKFPQVRYFRHAFDMVRGKYDEVGAKGDTTHFRALTTALSGTVGTGNIAGVATAVFLGGPGALFWMWCTALVGMATKYGEAVLAVKYREVDELGNHVGGPMYYIRNGLGAKWGWLAFLFAVFKARPSPFYVLDEVDAALEYLAGNDHVREVVLTGVHIGCYGRDRGDSLAGLVVGGMSDMNDNPIPFGRTAEEIIADAVQEYDYPVIFGFPAGHLPENLALIMGARVRMVSGIPCLLQFV